MENWKYATGYRRTYGVRGSERRKPTGNAPFTLNLLWPKSRFFVNVVLRERRCVDLDSVLHLQIDAEMVLAEHLADALLQRRLVSAGHGGDSDIC